MEAVRIDLKGWILALKTALMQIFGPFTVPPLKKVEAMDKFQIRRQIIFKSN